MNKKISLGAAIAFALIVAAAVFSVTMVYSQREYNKTMSSLNQREMMYTKLAEIEQQVREKYYGYASVNLDTVQDHIAQGYLEGIGDPEATYYSVEDRVRLQKAEEGEQAVGIGAKLEATADGYLEITEVFPDSSAQTAGLEEGNQIIRVEDIDLTLDNNQKMIEEIKGPEGSKITLTVRRGGQESLVELTRRAVPVPTVYAEYLPGGIGYLRLTHFDENTSNQFNRELRALEEKGAKALILDLRDNESETMQSATRILDRILPAGPMIVTVDKDGVETVLESSDTNEMELPTVTLINSKTQGASELFALMAKHYQKTTLVGTKTAGQGVSKELIKLSDGSAIEITVAQYKTPGEDGIRYHEVGIKPDYDVLLPTGVTDWQNLEPAKDTQRQKAVELLATSLRKEGLYKEEEVTQAAKEAEEALQQEASAVEDGAEVSTGESTAAETTEILKESTAEDTDAVSATDDTDKKSDKDSSESGEEDTSSSEEESSEDVDE